MKGAVIFEVIMLMGNDDSRRGAFCLSKYFRSNFGAKLEHLLSSRAEIISRMHRPPPAEGNDLEELLGEEPLPPFPLPSPNVHVWSDEKAAAFCALTPPLETFMVVPDEIRRDQFFHTARQDDMLIGYISAIQDSGLIITLLAYDQGPRRDFDHLKLTGFCPVRQLPRYAAHGNALDAFQIGDKVRAFILDVHHSGRLILSMNPKALNRDLYGDLKLGVISDEDLPLHFKINLPKPEMACELRRVQLYNLSMKQKADASVIRFPKTLMHPEVCPDITPGVSLASTPAFINFRDHLTCDEFVAQGVKYFKEGRNTEALQCYNFAIEVESSNPDAYVARGALYASIASYPKAVEDLEKSLQLQPNHANAKNYLGQTLLAYACEVTNKDPSKAEQLLKRALKLDPDNQEAREALRDLPGSGGHSLDIAGGGSEAVSSHMERSRIALEQLVEEDRSRRAGKEQMGRRNDRSRSPDFYSPPSRRGDDRSRDEHFTCTCPFIFQPKPSSRGPASGMDKGDLAKIVITRNLSGRTIRCENDGGWQDMERDNRSLQSNAALLGRSQDQRDDRQLPPDQYQYDRRVYTPPKDAKEVENGVLTRYTNESDLPMTSKTLQARVQQRLRDIERRHRMELGGTVPPGADGQGLSPPGGPMRGSGPWRGRGSGGDMVRRGIDDRRSGPPGDDRRGGEDDRRGMPGQYRNDFYRGGGNFYGRGRGRGGPRWRGQWDDWRSGGNRRGGNWYGRDNRRISRARIRTPPLAPLTNPHSDSEEQMADVEQFIAQLKAKRQMQQEMQGANQHSAPAGPLIGPQMPTPMETGAGASTEDMAPPSPDA
ncbi:unnamed protein product [Schistocephalus solidus]|uniref:S1 motif domain-containing protein n=1 Tax=Schistocephalus solidus TaxID=70667 RepID=A0A183T6X6_SCHSO|nr:unnamed protein product [Schistocephalus solidus]